VGSVVVVAVLVSVTVEVVSEVGLGSEVAVDSVTLGSDVLVDVGSVTETNHTDEDDDGQDADDESDDEGDHRCRAEGAQDAPGDG